jgi:AMMECR1 domain-containing protein
MSITPKLKKCAGCNELKHIWKSHGKDKYCQPCWYSIEKPKSISPVSEKRRGEMDEYSKKRLAFLVIHMNCQAKLVGCTGIATDVHHSKGRTGDNYLNMSTWVALCRSCHSYVETHPEEAKELGLSKSRLNES